MGLRGILEVLTTRVAPGKAKGAMTGTVFAVYLGERDHWVGRHLIGGAAGASHMTMLHGGAGPKKGTRGTVCGSNKEEGAVVAPEVPHGESTGIQAAPALLTPGRRVNPAVSQLTDDDLS